ncbi:MAG: hypothetical protein IT559_06670 [Alphaproteobacteria bacterium]|nr:hypothetical protein [Alphaproteobacteria bacterium]
MSDTEPKSFDPTKVKFIHPPNTLKAKVGSGGIPESLIRKAQQVMECFESDFRPEARRLVDSLDEALKKAQAALRSEKDIDKEELVFPVMQLKANGGMFKYELISDVADICLQFMEGVEDYNQDTFEVIQIHKSTINTILNNNLRGSGGPEGYALVQELHAACMRYFKRHGL